MKQPTSSTSTVGIGIAIGAAIGVLSGALFTGNVELGWAIIIGAGLGVLIAAIVDARRQRDSDGGDDLHDD